MSTKIYNPIIPGFHADPSIICVGDDFYIANSTFEWFPGVQIYHSRDLLNWKLAARPLDTREHLDMAGEDFSDGVWAPCLSWCDGMFYLVFTDVKSSHKNPFKDTHNYLTCAPDIKGPWSGPVYLNSSGFDPSLFHDDDGRKWLVNMEWDFRKQGKEQFSGILLQEYDPKEQRLTGESRKIFRGTDLSITEGPHIYKKDGWYYLVTAEGGTGYSHAVSVARSRKLEGPYEVHPSNPLLTSWEGTGAWPQTKEEYMACIGSSYIKKSGHGSWCQARDGRWYLVHLGARPVGPEKRCILGRETSIQEIIWKEDGWCYLSHGGNKPADYIEVPADIEDRRERHKKYSFKDYDFLEDFQSLRVPVEDSWAYIDEGKGNLLVRGRESIFSRFRQSMLARRQVDFDFEASVRMRFQPVHFMQMAGLNYRYCEDNQYYLYLTYDEEQDSRILCLIQVDDGDYREIGRKKADTDMVELKVIVHGERAQFYYRTDSELEYDSIGPVVDAATLSDEYAKPMGFTGAFVGICVQDLKEQKIWAEFISFEYKSLEPESAERM